MADKKIDLDYANTPTGSYCVEQLEGGYPPGVAAAKKAAKSKSKSK